jgi:PAS domain-containing protein
MEDKKILEDLKLTEQIFETATEVGGIGIWALRLEDDTSFRNLTHDRIFGYEEKVDNWGEQICIKHVIQEDQPIIKKAFSDAIKTNLLFFEVRVTWPDKTIHWITATGKVIRDSNNKPINMIGVVTEITDRKEVEIGLINKTVEMVKFNKFMFGREQRIIELKEKIEELKKEEFKNK